MVGYSFGSQGPFMLKLHACALQTGSAVVSGLGSLGAVQGIRVDQYVVTCQQLDAL